MKRKKRQRNPHQLEMFHHVPGWWETRLTRHEMQLGAMWVSHIREVLKDIDPPTF